MPSRGGLIGHSWAYGLGQTRRPPIDQQLVHLGQEFDSLDRVLSCASAGEGLLATLRHVVLARPGGPLLTSNWCT
jgi:hypothetical protein